MKRRSFLKSAAAIAAVPHLSSLAGSANTVAQPAGASKRIARFGDGRDWFFEKRFGMFVHWGLYAIAGFHEQHQWRKRVARAEYEKFATMESGELPARPMAGSDGARGHEIHLPDDQHRWFLPLEHGVRRQHNEHALRQGRIKM